ARRPPRSRSVSRLASGAAAPDPSSRTCAVSAGACRRGRPRPRSCRSDARRSPSGVPPAAAVQDETADEREDEGDPDPATDTAGRAHAVPEEDPEDELAQPADRADLGSSDSSTRNRAAGCLEAELAALLF